MSLQALMILADQAKTNSTGRVDEHGLFRHRYAELCGIAFCLFSHFHIMCRVPPQFSPDFDDQEHGEYGRRDWYGVLLFPGKDDVEKTSGTIPMTYESRTFVRNSFFSDANIPFLI
jgi:hypothetical protein